mmetsp:Transcript_30776/g.36582  ORF Transcript_30776/g.36582 Transcript_30776/m.36582 type:complete len:150 (-) Transcript_30776:20-469(-)|eukprot:CAMPEP_0198275526 /NCGR_PEP_ID=MMETSP1447-20131203/64819_1 /TAXON_ID=420782 /ORGANISM="Chaetoceros dichaeta, Strain CCMP1751" /LENGTH=149 /DNA_ID=CAMNT_0043970401 /DNA_START=126 /DNA_END=575 /DNA_ORIENTATION=+
MRLLTHNYLQSNVKGTEKGYPLSIEPSKIEYEQSPMDTDFVRALLPKINYDALLGGIRQIAPICASEKIDGIIPELPESIELLMGGSSSNSEGGDTLGISGIDEGLLKKIHTILFDVHVVEGHLVCPDTGRRFPISMGIPNMILHEDEI